MHGSDILCFCNFVCANKESATKLVATTVGVYLGRKKRVIANQNCIPSKIQDNS